MSSPALSRTSATPGDDDLELAPRDVVARAVENERNAGRGAYLDCTKAIGAAFPQKFPTVFAGAQQGGIDPRFDLLPVAPACHYHMGGVLTDLDGKSSVDGLWVVGEVSSTGVHGANRLASNSLLEAVVFGARVANALEGNDVSSRGETTPPPDRMALPAKPADPVAMAGLRHAMSAGAALLRSAESLDATMDVIGDLRGYDGMTSGLFSALNSAELIVAAARRREESRGGHFRTDFPDRSAEPFHSLCRMTADGVSVEHAPLVTTVELEPAE